MQLIDLKEKFSRLKFEMSYSTRKHKVDNFIYEQISLFIRRSVRSNVLRTIWFETEERR